MHKNHVLCEHFISVERGKSCENARYWRNNSSLRSSLFWDPSSKLDPPFTRHHVMRGGFAPPYPPKVKPSVTWKVLENLIPLRGGFPRTFHGNASISAHRCPVRRICAVRWQTSLILREVCQTHLQILCGVSPRTPPL